MHKLEIDSVLLEFDLRKILSDVYLKCETGKITGLLGRNGNGKSCLMNIICGNLEPQSKSIRFDNKTIDIPFKKPELLMYLPQFNFTPNYISVKRIFEDFEIELFKGDCLNIEAFKKHRVKFTSLDEPTIWFAVFY